MDKLKLRYKINNAGERIDEINHGIIEINKKIEILEKLYKKNERQHQNMVDRFHRKRVQNAEIRNYVRGVAVSAVIEKNESDYGHDKSEALSERYLYLQTDIRKNINRLNGIIDELKAEIRQLECNILNWEYQLRRIEEAERQVEENGITR